MGRWLFLPDSVLKDLEILARSDAPRIRRLRSLLDSAEGLRTFAVYIRVAEILGISDQEAAELYSFWEYVQQERTENQRSGDDAIGEFVSFLQGRGELKGRIGNEEDLKRTIQQLEEKREVLSDLFEDCPNRNLAKKTSLLEAGPLPHLSDIKIFCDIRPVYNESGTAIVDHIAMITLRLGTHSGRLDESKDLLINLSELDLDRIETELQRVRDKLEVLKKSFPGKSPEKMKKTRRR